MLSSVWQGCIGGVLLLIPVATMAAPEFPGTLMEAAGSHVIQRSVLAAGRATTNIIADPDGVYAPGVARDGGGTPAGGDPADDEAAYIGLLIFGIVLILVGEMIHHFMPERRRSGKVFGGLVGVMAALLLVVFAGGVGVVVGPLFGGFLGWLAYRFHLLLGRFEQNYDITWDPDPEVRKQKRRELKEQRGGSAPWMRLLGLFGGRGGGPRGGGGSFGGGGASGKW